LALVLSILAALPSPAQEPSPALADGARDKIEAIAAAGERSRAPNALPIRTALTEAEIEAYLRVHGPDVLPQGITEPKLVIGSERLVRARAIVDLDAVRRARPRGWRDPLAYIAGSVEVIASGRIVAEDGFGRAELESATVAGVSVPRSVVHELVRFFSTSEERPEGIDLDRPFELPANIKRVLVERGRVTVVQ